MLPLITNYYTASLNYILSFTTWIPGYVQDSKRKHSKETACKRISPVQLVSPITGSLPSKNASINPGGFSFALSGTSASSSFQYYGSVSTIASSGKIERSPGNKSLLGKPTNTLTTSVSSIKKPFSPVNVSASRGITLGSTGVQPYFGNTIASVIVSTSSNTTSFKNQETSACWSLKDNRTSSLTTASTTGTPVSSENTVTSSENNASSVEITASLEDTTTSSEANASSVEITASLEDTTTSLEANASSVEITTSLEDTTTSSEANASSVGRPAEIPDVSDPSAMSKSSVGTQFSFWDTVASSVTNVSSNEIPFSLTDTIISSVARAVFDIQGMEEIRSKFIEIMKIDGITCSYIRDPFNGRHKCASISDTVEVALSYYSKQQRLLPHGKGVLKNGKEQVIYNGEWQDGKYFC